MDNKNLENKAKTLLWEDEDNRFSYVLCLDHYNLKVLMAKTIDENTVELTIYGKSEDVDSFIADYEEGDVEPLCSMSRSLEYDEDYEGWLNNEVWHMLQLEAEETRQNEDFEDVCDCGDCNLCDGDMDPWS